MRGYFGVAIYHPIREANVGSLFRTAHAYGASFLATIGACYQRQASDTTNAGDQIPMFHFTDIDEMIDHLPNGCPLVGVEQDPRAHSLDNFVHPERALYLLGAEDNGIPLKVLDRCHYLLEIPTQVPWPLNVAAAGSIVVAHRATKNVRVT